MTQTLTPTRKIMATVVFALGLPTIAVAQEACSTYAVSPGDTLGTIAFSAYGTYDYQILFDANRAIVGTNPNNVAVGTVLSLPCEDRELTDGPSRQTIIDQQNLARASAPTESTGYQPPMRMLTGSNWAPFSEETMNGGGFLTILSKTAMERGGNTRPYSISFVNDWGSHMDVLLPSGAFDVGLGWMMPDCTKIDMLSDTSARRCLEYIASVPLYEPVMSYFTAAGSKWANATSFEDLKGATVCRNEGYTTHDLEEEGIAPPDITYIHPIAPEECIEAILFGTADITGMELQSATDTITKLGVGQEMVEISPLSKLLPLRILAHKSNPYAHDFINMLNRGLNEMRQSGEWYAIVSGSLNEHNQILLSQ
jgi:ABC-type amino acid transport substrate-binding protein